MRRLLSIRKLLASLFLAAVATPAWAGIVFSCNDGTCDITPTATLISSGSGSSNYLIGFPEVSSVPFGALDSQWATGGTWSYFASDATNSISFFLDFPGGSLQGSFDNYTGSLEVVEVGTFRLVSEVPEPGTLALLAFGLAGLGLRRRH
jgi:hypothetical protein